MPRTFKILKNFKETSRTMHGVTALKQDPEREVAAWQSLTEACVIEGPSRMFLASNHRHAMVIAIEGKNPPSCARKTAQWSHHCQTRSRIFWKADWMGFLF